MPMKLLITIGLLCLMASPALATEASFEKNMARGTVALEESNFPTAIAEFREGLKEHPDDADGNLYLGIALSRANDPEAETVLKKSLRLAPDNPRTNMELGIVYLNARMNTEAADYLENAKKLAPGSDVARQAEELLRRKSAAAAAKRWQVKLLTGLQFDSNVVLNSDSSALPQGISRKSDWRAVLNGSIDYAPIKNDTTQIKAGYSFYQSLHTRLTDFNITQNLLELSGEHRLSPKVALKAGYAFEYLLLGGDSYDMANSLAPAITFTWAKGLTTTAEYRFRSNSFYNTGIFGTNSERSGINHQIGITQTIPVGEEVSFRLGYAHDEDVTRTNYWDYSGDRGSAGVSVLLPYRAIVNLGGDITSRRYGAIYPYTTTVRDDFIGTLSVAASKMVGDHFAVTLGFFYDRNQSNLTVFDYVRTITSLMLSARY